MCYTCVWYQPECRLQTDYSTVASWNPYASSLIRTDRHIHFAEGYENSATTGATPAAIAPGIRIVHRTSGGRMGCCTVTHVLTNGLADNLSPSPEQACYDCCVRVLSAISLEGYGPLILKITGI